MAIIYKQIADDGFVIIVDGSQSMKNFKELVQRATNLWPDAQPEIKEFADQISSSGSPPLQDYRGQAKDKIVSTEKSVDSALVHRHVHHCSCGYRTVAIGYPDAPRTVRCLSMDCTRLEVFKKGD